VLIALCIVGSSVDVPSEPRNVAVSSVTEKSIGLRWDEPETDGGCDLTQYVVEVREGTRRSWQRAGVSSLADERRYTALALTAGQQYVFRVAAENRVGVGDWAEMTQSVIAKSAHGTSTLTCNCYWFTAKLPLFS